MTFSDLVKKCGVHSDQVRAALNAIPSDILLDIPENRLPDLIRSIGEYGRKCYAEGREFGE